MKKIWLPALIALLGMLAYLVSGYHIVEAAKPAKKAAAPPAQSQHAGKVNCAGCHGKGTPKPDSTVENQRCLECHGPMEKLAKKSEPKDFPDRNPHKSHLDDIACTVCHHEHSTSKAYCLQCHPKFQMKIPGDNDK